MKAYLVKDPSCTLYPTRRIMFAETVGQAKYDFKKNFKPFIKYTDLRATRIKTCDPFVDSKIPLIELLKLGYVLRCPVCNKKITYNDYLELDCRIVNDKLICYDCERRKNYLAYHHVTYRLLERYNIQDSDDCIRVIHNCIDTNCFIDEGTVSEVMYRHIPIKVIYSPRTRYLVTILPYFLLPTETMSLDEKKKYKQIYGSKNKIRKRERKHRKLQRLENFKDWLNHNPDYIPDDVMHPNKKYGMDNIAEKLLSTNKYEFNYLYESWKSWHV